MVLHVFDHFGRRGLTSHLYWTLCYLDHSDFNSTRFRHRWFQYFGWRRVNCWWSRLSRSTRFVLCAYSMLLQLLLLMVMLQEKTKTKAFLKEKFESAEVIATSCRTCSLSTFKEESNQHSTLKSFLTSKDSNH